MHVSTLAQGSRPLRSCRWASISSPVWWEYNVVSWEEKHRDTVLSVFRLQRGIHIACRPERVQCACTVEELVTSTRRGQQFWEWGYCVLLPGECVVLHYLIFMWPCPSHLSLESHLISDRSCSNSILHHPHAGLPTYCTILLAIDFLKYGFFSCFHNPTILLVSTTWHNPALWV